MYIFRLIFGSKEDFVEACGFGVQLGISACGLLAGFRFSGLESSSSVGTYDVMFKAISGCLVRSGRVSGASVWNAALSGRVYRCSVSVLFLTLQLVAGIEMLRL